MKLLYCTRCHDIVRATEEWRSCQCGMSSAHYIDNVNLEHKGAGMILGFSNHEFMEAIEETLSGHHDPLIGKKFTAFVISPDSKVIHKLFKGGDIT